MSTYLGRMYNVYPAADLEVVMLDYLDQEYQPPVSEYWYQHVRDMLNMYVFATERWGS